MSTKEITFETPKVTVDGNRASAELDEKSFLDNAPLSKEDMKKVFSYISSYGEKNIKLASELASKTMNKNKDVDVFELKAPFGSSKRDTVTTTVKRSVTYINPADKTEITKPAIAQTIKSSAFKNRAAAKRAVDLLKENIAGN